MAFTYQKTANGIPAGFPNTSGWGILQPAQLAGPACPDPAYCGVCPQPPLAPGQGPYPHQETVYGGVTSGEVPLASGWGVQQRPALPASAMGTDPRAATITRKRGRPPKERPHDQRPDSGKQPGAYDAQFLRVLWHRMDKAMKTHSSYLATTNRQRSRPLSRNILAKHERAYTKARGEYQAVKNGTPFPLDGRRSDQCLTEIGEAAKTRLDWQKMAAAEPSKKARYEIRVTIEDEKMEYLTGVMGKCLAAEEIERQRKL